jgi:hypothetical protein
VFQLAPGKVTVHPMAFTFPTRAPERLFFPTVHVHDGRFHTTAKFDHALYYQREDGAPPGAAAGSDAISAMTVRDTFKELLLFGKPVCRRTLHARLANADTWIDAR